MSAESFHLPLTPHELARLTAQKAHQAREPAVDRESFERLMTEHLAAAHRLAIRLTGRAESAEDLVQEAMLRASRAWQSFRGQSRFTTWLFQIVINVFRDRLRRREIRAETVS